MEHNKEFKNLPDNQKDLYIFTEKLISDELINTLKEFYEVSWDYRNDQIKDEIDCIYLIPNYNYLICINSPMHRKWFYKKKVFITKKQVDKFITLNLVMPISFIDFILLENEK